MPFLPLASRKKLNRYYNPEVCGAIDDAYDVIRWLGKPSLINDQYSKKNSEEKINLLKKNEFGAAKIHSKLNNRLTEIYYLNGYYMYSGENNFLIDSNKPYLAGISGMCNCFYNLFSLMNINIESDKGVEIMKLMSAFVVGLGFHTFQECIDSFNITHNYVEYDKQANNSVLQITRF